MADIRYIVSVDASGAVKEINPLSGAINTLKGHGEKATSAFAGLWKQMAAGFGVMALAHKGIQLIKQTVTDTIQKGLEFEKEWANTTTMLGLGTKATLNMRNALMQMSPHLGTATELAKGMYQVLSASIEPAKAIEFLGTAAKAAKAGLVETSTAVDALSTVINAYGMEAEKATDVSDIMFQTVKRGKLTYDEMASSLGTVVPIAAQAGLKFEEVGAAMATLTRQGIDANTATVQLRQILVSIIKPSKEAAKAAAACGIEFNSQALASKGLGNFLADVSEKTKGNIDTMTLLFGNVRALTGVLGLAGEQSDDFRGDLELMKKSAGSTKEAFNKQMQSMEFWVEAVKTSADKFKVSFMEGIFDPVRKSVTTFEDFDRIVKEVQASLYDIGTIVGKFAVPAFDHFKGLLSDVSLNMKFANVWIKAFGDIIKGHIPDFNLYIHQMAEAERAIRALKDVTQEASDIAGNRVTVLRNEYIAMLNAGASTADLTKKYAELKRAIQEAAGAADDERGAINLLEKATRKLEETKARTVDMSKVWHRIQGLWAAQIKETAIPAANDLNGALQVVMLSMGMIPEKAKKSTEDTGNYFDGLYNDIARGFGDATSGLIGDICNGLNFADGKFFEHGVNFKKYFGEAFDTVKEAFFRMIGEMVSEKVLGLFKGLFSDVAKTGKEALGGVADVAGNLGKAAGGIASGLLGSLGSIGSIVSGITGVLELFKGPQKQTDVTYWLKMIKDNSQILVNYFADTMVPATHNIEKSAWDMAAYLSDIKLTSWDQTQQLYKIAENTYGTWEAMKKVIPAQSGVNMTVDKSTMFMAHKGERVQVGPENFQVSGGNVKVALVVDGKTLAQVVAPYALAMSRNREWKMFNSGLVNP